MVGIADRAVPMVESLFAAVVGGGEMRLPAGTRAAWARLGSTEGRARSERFDTHTLDSLPAPARRWLTHVVPADADLVHAVKLSMSGEIKLGNRWMHFTARQILRAGVGFVWEAVVGGRLLRFVGADMLGPDEARMEFRLHGVVPVAKASGVDTARSAAGRLVAETVAWLPQAVTPQAGARWRPLDDDTAILVLDAAGETVEVQVTVDAHGELRSVELQRWNDAAEPPAAEPFGAAIATERVADDGVRVAGSGSVGWGSVGWGHGNPAADGEFFRYTLTGLEWIAPA